MLKTLRLAAIAALTAFTLVASSAATAQSPVLNRVVKTGKLRVGMSGDQPPLNVKSKSGQMIGLEVDLARGLAYSLGLEVELVQKPFGQLLPALKKAQPRGAARNAMAGTISAPRGAIPRGRIFPGSRASRVPLAVTPRPSPRPYAARRTASAPT